MEKVIDLTNEEDSEPNKADPEEFFKPNDTGTRRLFISLIDEIIELNFDSPPQTVQCGICFDNFVILDSHCGFHLPCNHVYCSECAISLVQSAFDDSSKFPLRCPQVNCREFFNSGLRPLKRILERQKLLEKFTRKQEESKIENPVYCPSRDCDGVLAPTKRQIRKGECLICTQCNILICVKCKVPSHDGMTCEKYQSIPESERSVEDLDFLRFAQENNWKRCTRCKRMVEKLSGCNYMRCRCGNGFCYKCGLSYIDDRKAFPGNAHGQAACQCALFEYIPPPIVLPEADNIPIEPPPAHRGRGGRPRLHRRSIGRILQGKSRLK